MIIPKPLDTKEIVTIREIAISNTLEIEALIELLDEKWVITKDELRSPRSCLFVSEIIRSERGQTP